MSLPDFLIIGSPKAGSTALHDALAQHPDLFLSQPKEPKFFMTGGTRPSLAGQRGPGDAHSSREWVWRQNDYEALFDRAPEHTLRGESTPFYLWDQAAHLRIKAAIPNVKMIAVIRDPIDRAYSNWTHLWCDGLEPEADFLTACDLESRRVSDGYAPFWRYLEVGRYGEQLSHLYQHFAPEQVHVLRYRQLIDEPERTLDGICSFLGIRTGLVSALPSSNVSTWVAPTWPNQALQRVIRVGAAAGAYAPPQVWRQASRPLLAALHRGHRNRPGLDPAVRAELLPRIADDVALLSELTGVDYRDWLGAKGRGTYSVRKS